MLHSDKEAYPILKKDKNNHWSRFNDNLKGVKLEGDPLQRLQKFCNAIHTAVTSTLHANKGIGDYEDLKEDYSIEEELVPPLGHT